MGDRIPAQPGARARVYRKRCRRHRDVVIAASRVLRVSRVARIRRREQIKLCRPAADPLELGVAEETSRLTSSHGPRSLDK